MKKLSLLIILLCCILVLPAKTKEEPVKDVTTFLGIPVDGKKSTFIRKLIKKGFVKSYERMRFIHEDVLEGEFNRQHVYVYFSEVNGLLRRVYVELSKRSDQVNIKTVFNNLMYEYESTGRYIPSSFNVPLHESIDLAKEVKLKNIEAVFYQKPAGKENVDFDFKKDIAYGKADPWIKKQVWFTIHADPKQENSYYIGIYYDNNYNAPVKSSDL